MNAAAAWRSAGTGFAGWTWNVVLTCGITKIERHVCYIHRHALRAGERLQRQVPPVSLTRKPLKLLVPLTRSSRDPAP
jgi:hypothetical protein